MCYNNNCIWIILILILLFSCGGFGGCGNGCGCNGGCGCNDNCGCC